MRPDGFDASVDNEVRRNYRDEISILDGRKAGCAAARRSELSTQQVRVRGSGRLGECDGKAIGG